MRKITESIVSAFISRKPAKSGNTYTDGNALFLHNNKIAEYIHDDLWINNAGWFSNTTKERLCSPSEFKRTRGGENNPNSRETWLDVQARALYQASRIVLRNAKMRGV